MQPGLRSEGRDRGGGAFGPAEGAKYGDGPVPAPPDVEPSLAVTSDGTVLATAGDSRTVTLWDAATDGELAVHNGHTTPVPVLALSRDGRRLATAGDDRTIIVWDTRTRQRVVTLTGHGARIRGLAFIRVLVAGPEADTWAVRTSDSPTPEVVDAIQHDAGTG